MAKQMEEATNTMSKVILVHGAWADASTWAKVIPLLTAKGLSKDYKTAGFLQDQW